jgi:hypothetical protein
MIPPPLDPREWTKEALVKADADLMMALHGPLPAWSEALRWILQAKRDGFARQQLEARVESEEDRALFNQAKGARLMLDQVLAARDFGVCAVLETALQEIDDHA